MEYLGWLLLIQGIIFGSFCAYIAGEKGRDGTAWFFAGLFFSLIALIAAAAVPVQRKKTQDSTPPRVKFGFGDECELTQKLGIYGEGTRVRVIDVSEIIASGQIIYKIVTVGTSVLGRFDVTEKALRRLGEQPARLTDEIR